MDPLDLLLSRDAAWRPPPELLADWLAEAARRDAPEALRQEARWWEAREAAGRGDWGRVSALALEGLGAPSSEREGVRLALLHALSGSLAETEHVLSQVIQWTGDVSLLRRFAELCAAEGLAEAAERYRKIAGGPAVARAVASGRSPPRGT